MTQLEIYHEVITEAKKSFRKYGHFNSTHEVYGVLKEEVDEFFDAVKANLQKEHHIQELIQIAGICIRCIDELENDQIKFT